jgi:biotin transport system substrate-specific component
MEIDMAEITLARPRMIEHPAARRLVGQTALAVTGSLFVALCAHVAIPLLFTPVPLSLAPFAVILLGLLLGPRTAFASLCLYLSEGALGMPVFSPLGPGGIMQLLGPTGGYLLSYPAAAALTGFMNRRSRNSMVTGMIAAASGSLLILVAGASWLKWLTHMDLQLLLSQAVIPFLPGDMLKVCAAAAIAKTIGVIRLRRQLKEFLSRDQTL